MIHSILALPTWVMGLLLIVVGPAIVILLQHGIRRRWPGFMQGGQNEVVGFIFAVVGVIFAVLLGFVVIVTWETYSTAEGIVGQEAAALRSLYRGSAAFPPQTQANVRGLVMQYATDVITQEWKVMARGKGEAPKVSADLNEMSRTLANVPAATPTEQQYIGVQAAQFNQLVSLRSQRLSQADRGIPVVLWIALIGGATVTIGFLLAFGLEHVVLHTLMTASLVALIGFLFLVVIAIDYPFTGDVAVHPHSFEQVLAVYK